MTRLNEQQIVDFFRELGIPNEIDRQRLLEQLSNNESQSTFTNVRFDIGFNSSLPDIDA
jgi:hypothetical protein